MQLPEFLDRLQIISNYFTLNITNIPNGKLRTMLEKMDLDETNERLAMMNRNLASFLSFLFKDFSGCRERNIWVMERYPQNINANTINSVLLFQQGNLTEADECVEYLKILSKDEFLMAEAKAEIANAYSLMGPLYYHISIITFEEVLQNYPYIYEWNYRLALTIRRCQNPSVRLLLPPALNNTTENFMKCKRIFEDILSNTDDDNLKAMAYVEMANLYISSNKDNVDLENLGINIADHEKIIIEYLDKAMELTDANEKILTETGRILRRLKRFAVARNVLETAVNIHPTTTNCHHLALVLDKLNGEVTESVAYLEQAVELSHHLNYAATVDLGKAYLRLSPPDYPKALDCGTKLLESNDIFWITDGCANKCTCYARMAQVHGVSNAEGTRLYGEVDNMKRQNVVYCALAFMKSLCSHPQDKFTHRELFPGNVRRRGIFYDYNSPRDQLKRAISICKVSTFFMKDVRSISNSDSLNEMIQKYLRLDKYQDCLDLVSILMVTDLPNIVNIALGVMMEIVSLAIGKDDLGLASSCFSRGVMSFYNVEEAEAHIRLIYDRNSEDEADLIESWLTDVELKVTRNDEDIFAYMKREDALKTALSSNIVLMCIFKDNNCDLLDDYPVDLVTHVKPVLIPVIVNGSRVSPAVNNHQPMIYPTTTDTEDKGLWLKTFGERMFQHI